MKRKLLFLMMSLLVIASADLSSQNLISQWDGNDGAGGFYTGGDSKPNSELIGWDNTNSVAIPWAEANSTGGCRFRDGQSFPYENAEKGNLTSRHLMLRYDNDGYMNSLFIYPVTLEAGKDYLLSFDYFYGGSGNAGTNVITVGVGKAKDGTDRNAKTYTTLATANTVRTGNYIFTSTDAGVYYITFGGGRAWYGIANLSLGETLPSTDGLSAAITAAEALYDASKVGATDFQTAINAAKEFLNGGYSQAQIDQAVANLDQAVWDYKFANTYTNDPLDITMKLGNPDFEEIQGDKQQTILGWIKTGTNGENYCTRNDAGPLAGAFKTGNVYFQNWGSDNPDFSISQTLALPNGSYTLKVNAGGSEGTTGTSVYANEVKKEVISTGEEYVLDVEVVDGTLTIGFKSEGRNVPWAYADNFRLFYNGVPFEEKSCQPLAPTLNLISDFDLASLDNFNGWGNKSINTNLDYVYCGTTSGKITGTNGGSIDTKPIAMKKNWPYRVRAQIYVVGEGQFQLGLLGGGDLFQTSKNNEWELIDEMFMTGAGNCTGLYFNCQGRGGKEGYIDNWELYEWSADAVTLEKLVATASNNKAYVANLEGSAELKTAIETAEAFLATLTLDNIADKADEIIVELTALQAAYRAFTLANVSPEYPSDLTYFITNPSFENAFTGWTNNGFQTQVNTAFPLKDKDTYCEKYQSSGGLPDSDISQVITGLPNGFYKVVVAAGFDGKGAFIFANEDKLEFGANNTYSFVTEVTDGTMTIGVKLVNSTANYVRFDNFRLEYTKLSSEIYDAQQEVVVLLVDAEAITDVMQNTVAAQLATAIEDAKATVDAPTLESLALAKTALEAAISAATASVEAYVDLNVAILKAKGMDNAGTGYSEFAVAITEAEAIYAAATADMEAVGVATETLLDAILAYAVANASEETPADVTRLIVNPSFEANQADRQQEIPGWIKTGDNNSEYCTRNDAGPLSGAFKTGNVYFQYWNNASTRPDYSIYQEIALPSGNYTLVADAGGDEGTTGTFIFANNEKTNVTSTGSEYSVDVTVTGGLLKIGFESVNRTVNWSFVDNFRLFYKGDNDPTFNDLKDDLNDSLQVATGLKENSGAFIVKAEMNKLVAAITAGEAAQTSGVYDVVYDALEGMKTAITDARTSVKLCGELIPLFTEATTLITTHGAEVDPSALKTILDENYAMYENQTDETDNAMLVAAKAELETAIEVYKEAVRTVGIDDVNADGVKVYVDGSSIVVEGADYEIYTQVGVRVTDNTQLIPGIYIVKVAGQKVKVAVK